MLRVFSSDTYPDPKARAHAVGFRAGASGAAFAGGPVVGGLLVDTWGWRSIFLLNLPLGLLALALTLRFVTETPRKPQHSLDLLGQVLAIAALGTLTYALIESSRDGWSAPLIRMSLLGFVVTMLLFIAVESKTRYPYRLNNLG